MQAHFLPDEMVGLFEAFGGFYTRIRRTFLNLVKAENRFGDAGDWAELPYDIIHKVASHLEEIEDFFAFSSVCRSWRSVHLKKQWCPRPQIPWLMMLSRDRKTITTNFFTLYRNKFYTTDLPGTSYKRCLGTSSDWLLIIGSDLQMYLLNVFTRVTKSLPPGSSLVGKLIYKALVIKKPCTSLADKENLLVMVIFGLENQLAFCRPGYSSWIRVEGSYFRDVAYVKNQIFALCKVGTLVTIDIDGPHPPRAKHVTSPNHGWAWKQLFLVESSGDLLLVCHGLSGNDRKSFFKSTRFCVYCFDVNQRQWSALDNLGNRAIFLDDNCSLSIRAPDHLSCKSNSIYFAIKKPYSWDGDGLEHYSGVYDMTMGFAEPLCYIQYISKYYCPVWLMPTLC